MRVLVASLSLNLGYFLDVLLSFYLLLVTLWPVWLVQSGFNVNFERNNPLRHVRVLIHCSGRLWLLRIIWLFHDTIWVLLNDGGLIMRLRFRILVALGLDIIWLLKFGIRTTSQHFRNLYSGHLAKWLLEGLAIVLTFLPPVLRGVWVVLIAPLLLHLLVFTTDWHFGSLAFIDGLSHVIIFEITATQLLRLLQSL